MKNVLVLLNARAGTLLDIGAESVVGQVTTALKAHCEKLDVRLVAPREMRKAIADAAVGPHDTVIVGGGDGSVSTAVAAFSGSDRVLGVLPFGTMNLLARDLGMPTEPEEAIAALSTTTPRRIDLVALNGRAFHTLSGLGFFSHMARAREEVRGHPLGRMVSVVIAWFRALARTRAFEIDVVVDGRRERISALAALVTNNAFGAEWRRRRMDTGTLEMHLVEDQGALTKLKAGAALLTGTWRDDPGIRSIVAREITVASGRRHTRAATDGELIRERMPLRYRVLPQALTVLAVDKA